MAVRRAEMNRAGKQVSPFPRIFTVLMVRATIRERNNCVKWLLLSGKKEPLCAHYFHLTWSL